MSTWDADWNEGLEALDAISVKIERARHDLDVMDERLAEIEAMEAKLNPTFRSWFTGLFTTKENENV